MEVAKWRRRSCSCEVAKRIATAARRTVFRHGATFVLCGISNRRLPNGTRHRKEKTLVAEELAQRRRGSEKRQPTKEARGN